jgi:hypothetical protein
MMFPKAGKGENINCLIIRKGNPTEKIYYYCVFHSRESSPKTDSMKG